MSTSAEIFILVTGAFAIVGALATVLARSPLRAVMGLLLTVASTAGVYLALHAPLLAVLQLLVYAGAIVVLFIFVIMMIGPAGHIRRAPSALLSRTVGFAVGLMVTVGVAFTLYQHEAPLVPVPPAFGSVRSFGRTLYVDTLVPFELVAVTLLVAIVGAVAVARGRTAAETEAIRKRRAQEHQPDGEPEEDAEGPTPRTTRPRQGPVEAPAARSRAQDDDHGLAAEAAATNGP